MIRINLLPVREWRRREVVRQQVSIFFLSEILLLVALVAVFITVQGTVAGYRSDVAALRAEKQKLDYVTKKMRKAEAKRREVERKFASIESLQQGRSFTVRVLDELISTMPMDRVWLRQLTLSGTRLNMSGVALDNHTVALFMRRLKASPYFTSVNLKNTSRVNVKGHDLMNFALDVGLQDPKVPAGAKKGGGKR
ncbi:PilN domain-containing protein [Dissulfurirhabdus thermomarina]|uniref:PilN domain-containing protein n=1 Tax=Dissulfurirhabdus thermomarina TaxID=1765737 RepID=A0A6N9TUV0_DISTH|nr:PilN domain-containing protein [Dissulfurirhabdus thermomarina]NDY43207.1 PilN domain-containing protein [Dissulfurirhabdus thermomarina]NMX22447.1 PilN domain-containing protein [Dissulfurirhabdus thermomarina]